MSHPSSTPDPLVESLNPLVIRGKLSSAQADEVYRAVSSSQTRPGGPPTDAAPATGWHRPRLFAGLSVLGGTLLLAALLIASFNAQGGVVPSEAPGNDFSWKPFLIMAGITLLLGGLTVAAHLLLSDRPHQRLVTSVFGAFALVALVGTIVATWDSDALVYLSAMLMLVGGIAGFWYFRGQVLVAVAVLGGLVFISQLVSDMLDDYDGGSGSLLSTGMIFLAYGLVVAAAGWRFSCRTLAAMLGGGIALVAMWVTVVAIGILFQFSAGSGEQSAGPDGLRTDIRIALVLGMLVAVALVIGYVFTSYPGYLVLAFVGAVTLPGTAVVVASTEHPLRWAMFYAVLGAVLAALPITLGWRHQREQTASAPQASQPPGHGAPPEGPPAGYQGRL